MTHRIAQLFGDSEAKVADEISRLEEATGHQGHDVKLLSQAAQTARAQIAELGLDPEDTTPEELYHALRARYQNDADQFEADLGMAGASPEDRHQHSMEIARRSLDQVEVWTIKAAVIKTMLKRLPPIKTLKTLHYRSLDSMLKRTNSSVILAVAHLLESVTWQAKWTKAVGLQPASAHEASRLHFVSAQLPEAMSDLKVPETGTIVVDPTEPSDMLGQVLRAVEAAEQLIGKDYSLQLGQIHPSLRWWNANTNLVAWVDGQAVSFNIYDVADGHNSNSAFHERNYQRASENLWQKLTGEYQQLIDEFDSDQLITQPAKVSPVMVAAEVENV